MSYLAILSSVSCLYVKGAPGQLRAERRLTLGSTHKKRSHLQQLRMHLPHNGTLRVMNIEGANEKSISNLK